jgi:hypothetical protein
LYKADDFHSFNEYSRYSVVKIYGGTQSWLFGDCKEDSTGSNADVPIIYGDYFLTEAILRLLGKDFLIW